MAVFSAPGPKIRHFRGLTVYFHNFNIYELTITELNNLTNGISYSSVVLYHDRLHSFDQTTLNISSFSGFYSSINKTFTTSHSVKVKFRRGQSCEV